MKNQKSKTKNLLIISVVVLSMFVFARPTQAFWLFDFFKNKSNQETQTESTFPPIIQKLIDKFNLNPDEVEGVIEETHKERQAKNQERFEEHLNQAVSDGKITEEQKQAILAKKEEMQANRGEFKDLSPEERREEMEAHREEMKAWAEENGIDLSLLPMLLGKGRRGGFGRPFFSR